MELGHYFELTLGSCRTKPTSNAAVSGAEIKRLRDV
jgi:hypothetical protein